VHLGRPGQQLGGSSRATNETIFEIRKVIAQCINLGGGYRESMAEEKRSIARSFLSPDLGITKSARDVAGYHEEHER